MTGWTMNPNVDLLYYRYGYRRRKIQMSTRIQDYDPENESQDGLFKDLEQHCVNAVGFSTEISK